MRIPQKVVASVLRGDGLMGEGVGLLYRAFHDEGPLHIVARLPRSDTKPGIRERLMAVAFAITKPRGM